MALGSERTACNPTQLSLSPFFQYHYCIIGKVMKEFGEQLNSVQSEELKSELRQIFINQLPEESVYNLFSDFTTIRKPESPTLAERGFINVPNVRISGNKPIDIGYYISCVNLHLYGEEHPVPWSILLDNLRLAFNADKNQIAGQQLATIIRDKKLPFAQSDKIVHTSDSGYTTAAYLAPLIKEFDNLLLISRMRYGMKVYKPYTSAQKDHGRPKDYEDAPYYLQTETERTFTHRKTKERYTKRPIFELSHDEEVEYEATTLKGRQIIIQIYRWNDVLLRGKNGHKMADKPCDLICIRFIDKQTAALLHKHELFVGIWGKNRSTHTPHSKCR